MTSHRRTQQTHRHIHRRKALTIAASLALAASIVLAPPAVALTPGPLTEAGAIPGYVFDTSAWTGEWSHFANFAMRPVGPRNGKWLWCVSLADIYDPDALTANPTGLDGPYLNRSQRDAWLPGALAAKGITYSTFADAQSRLAEITSVLEAKNSTDSEDNAAAAMLIHFVYDGGDSKGGVAPSSEAEIQQMLSMMVSHGPAAVWDAARTLWNSVGAYRGAVTVNSYSAGIKRSGSVSNIGVGRDTNHDGKPDTWVAGRPYTLTIDGPAVWNSNGSTTLTGTTGSAALTARWTATGTGKVTVNARYTYPNGYGFDGLYATNTSAQDVIYPTNSGGTGSTSSPAITFDVELLFQPVVTTAVAEQIIDSGDRLIDTLVSSVFNDPATTVDDNDIWVTPFGASSPISVVVDVTAYGPFESKPPVAAAVPAGAPLAGTASVTLAGAGATATVDAGMAVQSGYYTFVAAIHRANQPEGNRKYLRRDSWTDAYGLVDETSAVRLRPAIRSDVPAASEHINKGDSFSDDVTLSGAVAGDLWLAPDGDPLRLAMLSEVFGPYAHRGQEIADDAQPVTTAGWVASSYGTTTVDFPGDLALSGYYTVRTSIDTTHIDDVDPRVRTYLDLQYWQASDGLWAPEETIIVRMDPVVTTERASRIIDEADLPQPLIDHVTLTLRDDGDQWLHAD
ncbi:MAG: hypothetical protein LBB54_07455, partial [Cellulomonadaceae bacterium]|nr:hypothetical protein [Cellulomonadaceae bacterium]